MESSPSDELAHLKAEITHLNETLRRKNVQLDALHMVWCDGGCPGGVHRHTIGPITEELVTLAERNTVRLRTWFNAARYRLDNHTGPRWEDYHARIRSKLGEGE